MKRLVFSEYKKLWKRKITVVLLLVLILLSGYRIYHTYHANASSEIMPITYETVEHEKVNNGLEYYQYADRYLHQYTGEFNASLIQKMNDDYQKIRKQYARKNLDVEKMQKLYGSDWETFIKGAAQGKYNEEQLQQCMKNMEARGYSSDEKGHYYFEVYYKEDPVYMLYQRIYTGYSSYATSNEVYGLTPGRESIAEVRVNKYLPRFSKHAQAGKELFENAINYVDPSFHDKSIEKHYENQLMKETLPYDSTVGNHLMLKNIDDIDIIFMLILVVLLADIFAQEKHYKTDQIMIPTKDGAKKLVKAKLLCGTSLAVGILLLQYSMIFIATFLYVPLRSLDLAVFSQADAGYINMMSFVFTYREVLFSMIVLMLIATLAVAVVTMTISYFSKNSFITVIVMLLLLLFPFVMSFGKTGIFAYISSIFPTSMLAIENYFSWLSSGYPPLVNIMNTLVPLKNLVCAGWCVAIVLMLVIVIRSYNRHIVNNH